MMAGYTLRKNLSFCRIGDRHVFLDLSADRYFCLQPAADRAFSDLVSGTAVATEQLGSMLLRGDLEPVGGDCLPAACNSQSARSQVGESEVNASLSAMLDVLARRSAWRLQLKFFPLAQLVSQFQTRKAALPINARAPIDVRRLRTVYRRANLAVSAQDQCLAVSFALAWQLLGLGFRPDLILGVKMRPFEAHCWVQLDDALVIDDLDTIRLFTPILVV